ncbi:MAG TPA: DEAD/DEAH box helicase [Candidatus Limnocylindria bacterium]|nr:DEAD/DEAH box helicase [Candidatus Limnocylindria bacterium]
MTTFKDFPLRPSISKALDELGFTQPTEIQVKALQNLLTEDTIDFHGQAQTGTGKTLAFGIPLIHSIDPKNNATQGLIVAPTRELVVQICESLRSVARFSGISIEPIYGGMSMQVQLKALRRGVHIVVGTPGRLNDHLRRKSLELSQLRTLVLDEADIMLEMGFKEEIDEIITYAPQDRQIWLFSATVKPGIQRIKTDQMNNPVTVRVAAPEASESPTKQYYCVVHRRNRLQAVSRFIEMNPDFYGVIFCQTKLLSTEVAQALQGAGYTADALHGDMSQALRNKVIQAFRDKKFTILVATDVAARGIDVANLTHVVNYSLPDEQERYVHRIGRTGRAGKEGVAITFLSNDQVNTFTNFARRTKMQVTPLEMPTAKDIAVVRLAKVKERLDQVCNRPIVQQGCAPQVEALLADYTPEQLRTGMFNILGDTMLKDLLQEQKPEPTYRESYSDREPRGRRERSDRGERSEGRSRYGRGERNHDDFTNRGERRMRSVSESMQEIELNVGADDGVTKKDVVGFVASARSIRGKTIGKITVGNKRSFAEVESDLVDTVSQELHGKRINGRQIRVSPK